MNNRDYVKQAVLEASSRAGSQLALAKTIKANPQEINSWLSDDPRRARPVPAERACHMEMLYGIDVERFAPGLQWTRVADTSWPHKKGRPVLDVAKRLRKEAARICLRCSGKR